MSAAGPNPLVVQKLLERAREFHEGQNTEEVYKPIVDHGEAYRVAFEKMTAAIRVGDMQATKLYFDECEYHELLQRAAGEKARIYFLGKVQA